MRRSLLSALLAAAGVFLTPAAARAHAELISSQPAYGDRLATAPTEVRLSFSGSVNLTGARLSLRRPGGRPEALAPALATPDRRVVSIPLPPRLPAGTYTVVWYFLGNDGHLMGGELPFEVAAAITASPAPATVQATPAPVRQQRRTEAAQTLGGGIAGPALIPESEPAQAAAPERSRFRIAVATPQALVRLLDYASLATLIGGGFFLVRVWTDGTRERRARQLLWWALLGAVAAALGAFALTAAGLRGVGALDALDPAVMGSVLGTRYSRIMSARAAFLGLGVVALAVLTIGRDRAVRSRWWQAMALLAGGGVVATHALLGHASDEGLIARLAVVVHLTGVAVWLGGLVFLAAVVLPRRQPEEVRVVLPRFSRVAFTAVTAMVVAGALMMLRVVPSPRQLPQTGYGRLLLLKLAFVGFLLIAAQQARAFTERRLVRDATRLRPLLAAVGVELVLAVVILTSTAVLAGRVPPRTDASRIATPSIAPPNAIPTPKGR